MSVADHVADPQEGRLFAEYGRRLTLPGDRAVLSPPLMGAASFLIMQF
jgi:hypothetical protein